MKTNLILAMIVATTLATTANAVPRHRSHVTSSEVAATKALNEKALQQASASGMATPRTGAMSGSGAAAPAASMATPDATPMAKPGGETMAPATGDTATPPTAPTTPQ